MSYRRLFPVLFISALSVGVQAQSLNLSKVLMPGPDFLGTIVEFEIILTNESEAVAHDVIVEEDLPEGLALVEADASAGRYDYDRNAWLVGDLAAGQSERLVVRTDRLGEGPITNCVFAQYMTGGGDSATSAAACAMVEPIVTPPEDLVTFHVDSGTE